MFIKINEKIIYFTYRRLCESHSANPEPTVALSPAVDQRYFLVVVKRFIKNSLTKWIQQEARNGLTHKVLVNQIQIVFPVLSLHF